MELGFGFSTIVIVVVALYVLSSIKILAEYERGVIFRLGRLLPEAKGPGIILVFAPVDRMVRISLRQEALEVPPPSTPTAPSLRVHSKAYSSHSASRYWFSEVNAIAGFSLASSAIRSCFVDTLAGFKVPLVFLKSSSVATVLRFPRPGPPEERSPLSSVLSKH